MPIATLPPLKRAAARLAVSGMLTGLCALAGPSAALADDTLFKHVLDGAKIEFVLKPGEVETPAVKEIKTSGKNLYIGDAAAIDEGKKLYGTWCAACHNADGKGRLGPPLIGKDMIYPQSLKDAGFFAIVYAGATGAMQPFSKRAITQDQMVRITAYVRSLEK